jgi:BirA family transcriptional regulator, biotin operon repressor / biotin---[acetyl-CoA-carboxylase] ligase
MRASMQVAFDMIMPMNESSAPPVPESLQPERLAASQLVARVDYFETIASTQDRALELGRNPGNVGLPLLVVAEEQTAGRGRGTNRWWTGRGSLAFSLVFDPADWALSRETLPERSLAVGLAIAETVRPLVGNHVVGLHWPNDVFASGKKLAGVLIDVLPGGRHVVGVGLNVNNSLAAAPDDVRARATSLCELAGRTFDRTALLMDLLANLEATVRESATSPHELGERFQQHCLQLGQDLTIEVGSHRTIGRCLGIAPDGALLLDTSTGCRKFYSGVLIKGT